MRCVYQLYKCYYTSQIHLTTLFGLHQNAKKRWQFHIQFNENVLSFVYFPGKEENQQQKNKTFTVVAICLMLKTHKPNDNQLRRY